MKKLIDNIYIYIQNKLQERGNASKYSSFYGGSSEVEVTLL